MKTPHQTELRNVSMDPIAAVRLWPLLPLAGVAMVITGILVPSSSSEGLREAASAVALSAATVLWWLDTIHGGARRAGFQPVSASARAVLLLSSKVAAAHILGDVLWSIIQHALDLPSLGFGAPSRLIASETTAQSVALSVVVVALVAPVAEEMLFRGALFRKWRLRWSPVTAAVVTSVLFGLIHPSAPTAVLSGLSMTVLYTATGTIWAPVAAHAIHNLLVVMLRHSVPLLPLTLLERGASWPGRFALFAAGLIGTGWLVLFLRRGWHTLGDPVHGVRRDSGAESQPTTRSAAEGPKVTTA